MTGIDEIIPDKLYLSGRPGATNYQLLKEKKIYSIVNMSEGENMFKFNYVYLKLDIKDHPTQNIKQYFERVFKFINRSRGRVLVHCLGGISRSSSFVIGYLMENEKKCLREALEFTSERRIYTQPNEGFMNQLIEFERELIEEKKILAEDTKKYSMEEYKCFCIRKFLREKKFPREINNEDILEVLRLKNQKVSETIEFIMYKR